MDRSVALASSLILDALAGRDVRPAAQSLSLSRQRKEPKKGAPTSATPALRCGADLRRNACGVRGGTRCVRCALFAQTTPASQTTQRVHPAVPAPPRKPCAAGAASRGWQTHSGHRCARPQVPLFSGPSAAMDRVFFGLPSGRAEKRRAWGGRMHRRMHALRDLTCCGCLSEENAVNAASSAAPPQARASQVARSEARGHGQWGRLFFAYFLLATQKKVGAPPGAYPGQPTHARPAPIEGQRNDPTPCPSPHPSPQRGEGARHSRAHHGRLTQPTPVAPHLLLLSRGAKEPEHAAKRGWPSPQRKAQPTATMTAIATSIHTQAGTPASPPGILAGACGVAAAAPGSGAG